VQIGNTAHWLLSRTAEHCGAQLCAHYVLPSAVCKSFSPPQSHTASSALGYYCVFMLTLASIHLHQAVVLYQSYHGNHYNTLGSYSKACKWANQIWQCTYQTQNRLL